MKYFILCFLWVLPAFASTYDIRFESQFSKAQAKLAQLDQSQTSDDSLTLLVDLRRTLDVALRVQTLPNEFAYHEGEISTLLYQYFDRTMLLRDLVDAMLVAKLQSNQNDYLTIKSIAANCLAIIVKQFTSYTPLHLLQKAQASCRLQYLE